MKYNRTILVASICLLTACSKEPEISNVETTAIAASMAEDATSLAKSLAVINPRHSESYYKSMIIAIVQDCVKQADTESCLQTKIEGLKSR